jgi:glycosyltransferase involved in cell wall biosynthesis
MNRKILFYTHSLAGGGAERVWAQLARGFAGRGDDVIFVQDFDSQDSHSQENAGCLGGSARRALLGRNHLLATWRLARLIAREQPDISVSALSASNLKHALAATIAGRRNRAVLSYHGHFKAEPQLLSRIAYLLTPLLTRLAASTVCVSDALRDYLAAVWRAPPAQTHRIYNPVDLGAGAGAAALPLDQRPPVVISASRLVAGKNIVGLLRAFARVQPDQARLVLLGEGKERPAIEAEIARLGLGSRVKLEGYAQRPWTHYGEARCFALFSDHETFGLVLAEAMACGLPVVSTDCGGPRELLDGGRCGRLVDVGDIDGFARALTECLARPGDGLIEKARALAFSLDAALDAYDALFDRVRASAGTPEQRRPICPSSSI